MGRNPLFRQLFRRLQRSVVLGQPPQAQAQAPKSNSRREFLESSAAMLALTALPTADFARLLANRREPIVILGAGAAGLAAAYTLHKLKVPYLVFEANDHSRTGRVHTQENFNASGQFCELGAELIDSNHSTISQLCREFDLQLEHLTHEEPGTEAALFFYGDQSYRPTDLVAGIKPLQQELSAIFNRINPHGLDFTFENRDQLPAEAQHFDDLSLADFLDQQTDTPKWIRQLIKSAYCGEFGLDPEQQSCLNLLTTLDFAPIDGDRAPKTVEHNSGFALYGDSDEAWRVQGGNSRLLKSMQTELGPLNYAHRLVQIEDDGRRLRCHFARPGQATVRVRAQQVICTLPFSVLREIPGVTELQLHPAKQASIQQLGYGTCSKIMLGFHQRYWRPATSGSYYMDTQAQTFWETSRRQAGAGGIMTNFLGGTVGAQAGAGAVQSSLRELARLDAKAALHFDAAAVSVANWAQQPFAQGAYSCLKPGQFLRFNGAAERTELKGRLLFAGEHTSPEFPGFLEGALRSGITAARQAVFSVA